MPYYVIDGKFCEVCGKPAVEESIDTMVQDKPKQGSDGGWYSSFHVEGPNHLRCEEHPWVIINRDSDEFKAWQKSMVVD